MGSKKDKGYTGNPVPEVQSNFDRSGGSRALAYAHQSLRQSTTDLGPTAQGKLNPVTFVGQGAFNNANSSSDTSTMRPQPDHGRPRVQVYDAAEQAGRYTAMHDTAGFTYGLEHLTGQYSSAATGAQSNGSHSLDQPCSTLPPASKASERVELMKQTMRRMG